MFLTLPADQTLFRDSMVAMSPEGVKGSSGSAVLNLLRKRRKEEGGRQVFFANGSIHQEWHQGLAALQTGGS